MNLPQQDQVFMNSINMTSDNLSNIQVDNHNSKANTKYPSNRPPLPHYWPADRVPYINITYCQLIQYLFAICFVSVLIWIFVGLKHFDKADNKKKDHLPQKQLDSKDVNQQIDEDKINSQLNQMFQQKANQNQKIQQSFFGGQQLSHNLNSIPLRFSQSSQDEKQFGSMFRTFQTQSQMGQIQRTHEQKSATFQTQFSNNDGN